MTSDAVRDLEKLFLPRLEKFKKECSDALPKLKFIVWSSSIGGQTDYQGHNLGIECLFPEATDEQADTVAIIVGIKHLTTTPLLCDASVEWGMAGIQKWQLTYYLSQFCIHLKHSTVFSYNLKNYKMSFWPL